MACRTHKEMIDIGMSLKAGGWWVRPPKNVGEYGNPMIGASQFGLARQ
jgi:hypothetical protein